jgi:uncharacterized protein (DUF58 family)
MSGSSELLKKVRKIEIKSRGLSSHIFSGEYHSAFKGRGMAFSEVREYQPGDDIRTIDWNVTARFNHTFVKVFEEERELTMILLVDMSSSGQFGTATRFKHDLVTEICAVLSFSALLNKDNVGAIFFTDKIEKFIPPKKGKTHILRIIRELLEFKPEHTGTNLHEALRYLTNVIKKKSIAFVLSDFMDKGFDDALKIANRKHDLIALRIFDEREAMLPKGGLMLATDAETGEQLWVDTGDHQVRQHYYHQWKEQDDMLNNLFSKNGVDNVKIRTDQSYVKPLRNMFKKRGRRA